MNPIRSIPLIVVVAAGGCAAIKPPDFNRPPVMSPVGAGLVHKRPPIKVATASVEPRNTSSLWRDRSADLFKDPRARHIGDTLTVKISISDKATIDSQSDRSRTASGGLNFGLDYDFGIKRLTGAGTADANTNIDTNSRHQGQGATSRSEKIDLLVAAVVTNRLPNGNLIISGTQEVRVNHEVRVLTVAGIVRPRDVATDNSVSYDRIAEARISYGGRGRITEVQQPRWGQQIIDHWMPY